MQAAYHLLNRTQRAHLIRNRATSYPGAATARAKRHSQAPVVA